MEKDTGGQAFPKQQWEYDGRDSVLTHQEDGMTLRDYFAAGAINGLLSDPSVNMNDDNLDHLASISYRMADAMLRARGL